jgi:hypothetical protein
VERRIDGPDSDWLSEPKAAAYLGLSLDTFRALVKSGVIPPARRWTKKTPRWPWKALVAVSWLMELGYLDTEKSDRDLGRDGPV